MITADRARQLLDYDPQTGVFIWKHRNGVGCGWNNRCAGKIAGSVFGNGYRYLSIEGRKYKASRLAWLYVYGSWPNSDIDHIDRNIQNDSVSNLRTASKSENMRNKSYQKNNSTKLKGVINRRRYGDYGASICVNRQRTWLGIFKTPEDAHAAYVEASKNIHGNFGRTM